MSVYTCAIVILYYIHTYVFRQRPLVPCRFNVTLPSLGEKLEINLANATRFHYYDNTYVISGLFYYRLVHYLILAFPSDACMF